MYLLIRWIFIEMKYMDLHFIIIGPSGVRAVCVGERSVHFLSLIVLLVWFFAAVKIKIFKKIFSTIYN